MRKILHLYGKQDSDYCSPVLNHKNLEGLNLIQTIADALCCPDCRADVSWSKEEVSCTACGKSYPIAEGIPQFAEMGAELGIELEQVVAGPSTSADYQTQYQDLGDAAEYNTEYKELLFKRWSTRREFTLLERLLDSQPRSTRLLDLPCGGGRLSPQIGRFTDLLIESDIGKGQVRYAREHSALDIPQVFMTSTAFKLPLRDNSVDGTVCIRLNHHMPTRQERERLMGEILRVSRRFVIMTYFDYHSVKNTLRRARRPFNKKPPKMTMRSSEVAAVAEANGARLLQCPNLAALSSGHRYGLMVKEG